MTAPDAAADFRAALSSLRELRLRPEIRVEEVPAPQRLAPYAIALSAEVLSTPSIRPGEEEDDEDLGVGRLVVLHDPEGQEAWQGTFRIVAFVRATLEPEMAADPMLAEVGWAWLVEALDENDAAYRRLSGTVTRVTSESFGDLADRPLEGQVELRASWTPEEPDLIAHARAWAQVLGQAAGLIPPPPGVTQLPRQRSPGGLG